MAKRTVKTETVTTEGEEGMQPQSQVELVEEPDPQDIALMRTITALRGSDGAIIRIYRQGPGGIRDLELLDESGPDEFTPMMLARPPFNGGKFRIHVQDAEGHMVLNQVFRIAPSREASAQMHGAPDMGMMERVLAQMAAGFERVIERLNQPQSPLNTLEGLTKIMELVKPAPPPPATTPAAELFTTLKLMRELKQFTAEGQGTFDDDGSIKPGPLLNKAADMLITALNQGKAQEAAQLPAPPAAQSPKPGDNAPPVPSSDQPQLTDEQQEQVMFFKLQLRAANRTAKANESPEDFADTIYPLIGDDMLRTLATDPQWFEKLCQIESGCAEHKDWYGKVRDALIVAAREDGILTPEPKSDTVGKPDAQAVKVPTSEINGARSPE